MPPTKEMIDKAIDRLSEIQLNSFTATPGIVKPLNDVTLKWDVTASPGTPGIVFKLGGIRVQKSGSWTIRPVRTISYVLSAEAFSVTSTLGSVTIQVDLTDCYVLTMFEHDLFTNFRDNLTNAYPEKEGKKITLPTGLPDLVVRAKKDSIQLKVDTGGIKVSGEFNVETNNAPDGILKFDALVALGAENGQVAYKILNFNSTFAFNLPGWLDILSLGLGEEGTKLFLTELAEQIITYAGNAELRDQVGNSITETLKSWNTLIKLSGDALVILTAAVGRVDATLCRS